jgi:hypothetical protein
MAAALTSPVFGTHPSASIAIPPTCRLVPAGDFFGRRV